MVATKIMKFSHLIRRLLGACRTLVSNPNSLAHFINGPKKNGQLLRKNIMMDLTLKLMRSDNQMIF